MPALETIVGKSARQLHRYLSDESPQLLKDESDIVTNVRILRQIMRGIEQLEKSPQMEQEAKSL